MDRLGEVLAKLLIRTEFATISYGYCSALRKYIRNRELLIDRHSLYFKMIKMTLMQWF